VDSKPLKIKSNIICKLLAICDIIYVSGEYEEGQVNQMPEAKILETLVRRFEQGKLAMKIDQLKNSTAEKNEKNEKNINSI
jgi:hypothetical protein